MVSDEYTEEEFAALDEKFEHPEKTVICPRCGQELVFREIGTSCEVRCSTPDCIYDCIRGL